MPDASSKVTKQISLFLLLLDRNAEFDKEILYEKYNILKAIQNSREFDEITSQQIRKYVNDGVFYVQGVMEVAIEGS